MARAVTYISQQAPQAITQTWAKALGQRSLPVRVKLFEQPLKRLGRGGVPFNAHAPAGSAAPWSAHGQQRQGRAADGGVGRGRYVHAHGQAVGLAVKVKINAQAFKAQQDGAALKFLKPLAAAVVKRQRAGNGLVHAGGQHGGQRRQIAAHGQALMPRWMAQIPPLRLDQRTRSSPALRISSARVFWSGKRRMDSARY